MHLWMHRPYLLAEQSAVFEDFIFLLPLVFAFVFPRNAPKVRFFLILIGLGAAFLAAFAFFGAYALKSHAPLIFDGRVRGTFSHPNLLAQYLAVVIPVAGSMSLVSQSRSGVRLAFLIYVVMAVALSLTYMRGALLASAAALGFSTALFVGLKVRDQRQIMIRAFALAGITIVLVAGLWSFDRPHSKRRTVLNELSGESGFGTTSISRRMVLWQQALRSSLEHPWFGCGAGRSLQCLAEQRRFADPEKQFRHIDAHQDSLQIAMEYGWPGLVLYWALMGTMGAYIAAGLYRVTRGKSPPETLDNSIYAICMASGAIAFILLGAYDFPWSRVVPKVYAFVLLGWAAALCGSDRQGEDNATSNPSSRIVHFSKIVLPLFAGGCALTVVIPDIVGLYHAQGAVAALKKNDVALAHHHCRPILANRTERFDRRLNCYRLMTPALGSKGLTILEQMRADYPWDYKVSASMVMADLRAGRPGDACREALRGFRLWPKHPAWSKVSTGTQSLELSENDRRSCSRLTWLVNRRRSILRPPP
ncbi:MAG: O-antigen ligase family protein [Deltaproteobacteria bacterium]|nr:O-antigen ligase family protein [Deltaproteobacteria bacterium]MCB9490390.1 O-antigen ligase family protein [Deltaproteobacteria bacterium]